VFKNVWTRLRSTWPKISKLLGINPSRSYSKHFSRIKPWIAKLVLCITVLCRLMCLICSAEDNNVAVLLPLAREYQIDDLTKRCEQFLLCRKPSVRSLVLAEEFSLETLEKQCLDYVNRSGCIRCIKPVLLSSSRPYLISHPRLPYSFPSSNFQRTRRYSDLQPDTVSAGLLQRCVVWCSSQQYSEAAACLEHCGEDRHTVAKKGTCSATAGTVTLASCSSTDRVQAGRTEIQDSSFISPSVPRPSNEIESNLTSSSFLRHAFTAQTDYQNSLRWPCFLLHCSYSLEFA